jgi:hypothetical protein
LSGSAQARLWAQIVLGVPSSEEMGGWTCYLRIGKSPEIVGLFQ